MNPIIQTYCSITDRIINTAVNRYFSEKEVSKIMQVAHIPNRKVAGEDEWHEKWKQLGVYVNRKYYRVFSRYVDGRVHDLRNICPDNVCHNYITPLLNPMRFRSYYQDKNEFDRILGHETFPKTLLRCMNGQYMDALYHPISSWGGGKCL